MDTSKFSYHLPSNYIAQEPLPKRDQAKLMLLDRDKKDIMHDFFFNVGKYLKANDCLILNESKVNKCRLIGKKDQTGAKIECFVLKKIEGTAYQVLLKPFKRLKVGGKVWIGDHFFIVMAKEEAGKAVVKFDVDASLLFKKYGLVPLPPYIKGSNIREKDYQTVYAKIEGSVAAPTAGLHFTQNLISSLKKKGIIFANLGLDIGIDTFRPISENKIEDHQIHSEYYYLKQDQADKIDEAKSRGGRLIAVGTTSVRVLETIALKHNKIIADKGKTSLYIYPGYKFRMVEAMITNFHLPRSSLLVMVSAFAGRDYILQSYQEAKQEGYRFFSFGDCMFIR